MDICSIQKEYADMEYTLRELFDRLKIPIAELGRRAGISEVTVAKIRDGASARRSSINRLLEVFSELYGVELSINNVSGIIIKDKLARLEAEKLSVSTPVVQNTASPQKRDYTREELPTDLPPGTVKLTDFTDTTGIPASTIGRWIREGKIEAITRDRVSGMGEQKYLIPSEQEKAKQLNEARTPRKTDTAPPEGFTYLSDFCTLHYVPYQAAEELFPRAIRGQKIKIGRRLYPVIGPKGRHDFYVQMHARADFHPCDDCPHEA